MLGALLTFTGSAYAGGSHGHDDGGMQHGAEMKHDDHDASMGDTSGSKEGMFLNNNALSILKTIVLFFVIIVF